MLYSDIDDAYGLNLLESMKNGIYVIVFEGNPPSETIINVKTGFIIKNNDLNDFVL
ncbi:MAG: glycosyltransferase [Promethearchaeota archaeon]